MYFYALYISKTHTHFNTRVSRYSFLWCFVLSFIIGPFPTHSSPPPICSVLAIIFSEASLMSSPKVCENREQMKELLLSQSTPEIMHKPGVRHSLKYNQTITAF